MFEQDENEVIHVLTRNAVKCLVCNKVLESKHRHGFVECGCHNQTFVDGGLCYNRVGSVDLDLVENLCEYKEMTRGEYKKQLEVERERKDKELQERIDKGEMINVGSDVSPHWVSKTVWDIVMSVSDKYYGHVKVNRGNK